MTVDTVGTTHLWLLHRETEYRNITVNPSGSEPANCRVDLRASVSRVLSRGMQGDAMES